MLDNKKHRAFDKPIGQGSWKTAVIVIVSFSVFFTISVSEFLTFLVELLQSHLSLLVAGSALPADHRARKDNKGTLRHYELERKVAVVRVS